MRRYLIRRALQVIPLFLIVSVMTFGLMHLAPGGPEQIFLAGEDPTRMNPEMVEKMKEKWGLNESVPKQYGRWLYNMVVKGDLGDSYFTGRPVTESYMARLPNSITLNVATLLLVYGIAIPLGVISAVKQYSALDYTATTFSFLGYAMPEFWVGLMLIYLIALPSHQVIPTSGISTPDLTIQSAGIVAFLIDRARYLLLPLITLLIGGTAGITRYMRSAMLEVLKEDYVRTARSKGLAQRVVIYKHAMRNALIPIITLSGGFISSLFSGSVVAETIFAWPGVGWLFVNATNKKDYPVVMAFLLIGFVINTVSSFFTEFLYVFVDPRIRYS